MAARRRKVMEQATAEADKVLDEQPGAPPGTEITVVWGEETISPVQYNSFRMGGHSIKVVIQPGETAHEAFLRGWAILEEAAEVMFQDKMKGFASRLDRAKGR